MTSPRILVSLVLAITACTEPSVPVASVELLPVADTLAPGASVQLRAEAFDDAGNELHARVVRWSSEPASVATISELGLLTAVAEGNATITARVEGQSASMTLTVHAHTSSVSVGAPADSLVAGRTMQLAATPRDSVGRALTGAGFLPRAVTWRALDTSVARVSALGLVVGRAPGAAVIEATIEGVSGSDTLRIIVAAARLTVSPVLDTLAPGDTVRLSATVRDSSGNVLTGRAVTWSIADPTRASISPSGLVTGIAEGPSGVYAIVESVRDSALLVVRYTVASLSVTGPADTVVAGDSILLSVTVRDAANRIVPWRPVTWRSLDAARAEVRGSGYVVGRDTGVAGVEATVEGITGSYQVRVRSRVARVEVSPTSVSLVKDSALQLSATMYGPDSSIITDHLVAWSSSNSNVASVSASGLVTGRAAGLATVFAVAGGRAGSVVVQVLSGPLLDIAGEWAISYEIYDYYYSSCAGTASATFTNSAGSVSGTVSSDGLCYLRPTSPVTGISLDVASFAFGTWDCWFDGQPDRTPRPDTLRGSVNCGWYTWGSWTAVRPGPPVSLEIGRGSQPLMLAPGSRDRLHAVLRDASGHRLHGHPATWSSSNTAVATIDSLGVLTVLGPGTVTITATAAGFTATLQLTAATAVVGYGAGGYRYRVTNQADPATGFEAVLFDDVAAGFSNGAAAFGLYAGYEGCPLSGSVVTGWPEATDLLLRKTFVLPAGARNVRIGVAIDDAVRVFLNGVDITATAGNGSFRDGFQHNNGCAFTDTFVFQAPDSILVAGTNVVALRARDFGGANHADLRVLVDP